MLKLVFWIALTAILLAAPPAFPQALAEYGVGVSNSSGTGVAAGTAIGRAIEHSGDALAGTTSGSPAKVITVDKTRVNSVPLDVTMQANRKNLEAQARTKGATVQIASVPAKSALYVDGRPVAYAPAEVRLPAGKHLMELRHPAFLSWQQQVAFAVGETVCLEPKLTPDGSQQVIVSFDNK